MKRLIYTLATALLLGLVSTAGAQARPDQKSAISVETDRAFQEDAKSLLRSGSIVEAEAKLAELIVYRENSARWHLDAARRLAQLRDAAAVDGMAQSTAALIDRVLYHLQQAEARAASDRERSLAKSFKGFVYERLLGDLQLAKINYQEAANLTPDLGAAREKLERLKRAEEATVRRAEIR